MRTLRTIRVKSVRGSVRELARFDPVATERMRGENWTKVRRRWLTDNPLCVNCLVDGLVIQADQLDHIVPLFVGGADDESNYQSLCIDCHKIKTKMDLKR